MGGSFAFSAPIPPGEFRVYNAPMSNIRKFPGRGPSKRGQGARDSGFRVVGLDGKPVDVLVQVVHAGGVFLIPMQEGAPEEPPTAQLLRTISSFDAFTDAANALVAHVRTQSVGQDAAESLVQFGISAQKVMRRLYESAPSDQIILAIESYGPEFHVEYATTAAMTVACGYALKILGIRNFLCMAPKERGVHTVSKIVKSCA